MGTEAGIDKKAKVILAEDSPSSTLYATCRRWVRSLTLSMMNRKGNRKDDATKIFP
jgi:hypothetical protein